MPIVVSHMMQEITIREWLAGEPWEEIAMIQNWLAAPSIQQ